MSLHIADEANRRRAWTRQLYYEHAQICRDHGVPLRTPFIELADLASVVGSWDAVSRTIRLAVRLVAEQSWDVLVGVLRHEMAHQAVTDLFRMPAGHDQSFQTACRLLGVPERFRRATGPLDCQGLAPSTALDPAAVRHLARLEKLLALAGSDNEHEAGLAMAKANALVARYNLEGQSQTGDGAYDYRIIRLGGQRVDRVHKGVASLLTEFFFVQVVLSSIYDPALDQSVRTLELLGRQENLEVAEYVHAFLIRQLDGLWQGHRRKSGCPGGARRSFQLGVLNGFRERLMSQAQPPGSAARSAGQSSTSLVVCAQDPRLQALVRERHPHLVRRRSGPALFDAAGYTAGVAAGRELTLHRGITRQGPGGRLLPEG
ncbi:MAG: DUF2786 domain-containing protein [Thermodesulfobacteriota bacterium]